MPDITDILSNEDELSNEKLINYLKGCLPEDEAHSVEKQMMNSAFVNDAVEGLQAFTSGKKMDHYVSELNKNIRTHLSQKKLKKKKKIHDLQWIIIAVLIILLLCLLSYFVIVVQKRSDVYRKNSISVQH